jgi:formylglycine-generating enzyme required for sulfatase activity
MVAALSHLAVRERASAAAALDPAPKLVPLPLLHRPWLRPALFALAAASVLVMTILLLRSPAPQAPVASNDFFTGREETGAAAPAEQPSLAAISIEPVAVDAASGEPVGQDLADDAGSAPPVALAPTLSADPPPAALPFGSVQTSVSVKALEFDPSAAGARELHAVPRQIKANHLSTPASDNAVASLQAAKLAGAPVADIERLGAQVMSAMSANIVAALAGGRDENARTAYKRAADFARASGQEKSEAWKKLRAALAPPLLARLDKAARNSDPAGFEGTRALARTLEVPSAALEPAWSRTVEAPRPGKVLRSNGPTTVLVQAGGNGRPGVAFMREEVSRADYAAFARSTQRPVTRCRNRLAPITIKKRTWSDPGFPQNDSHPAVCVSYADAQAYAQWLSSRTGETFRLPSAAEWRQIANYKGSGKACEDGRVNCGGEDGTTPVNAGPASPLGLVGVRGNAREWLSDCASGCRQHLVSGLGWRDSAGNADPIRSSGFDASVGFDDVGFRLVREVAPH